MPISPCSWNRRRDSSTVGRLVDNCRAQGVIGHSIGGTEDDPGPKRDSLWGATSANQLQQFPTFRVGHRKGRSRCERHCSFSMRPSHLLVKALLRQKTRMTAASLALASAGSSAVSVRDQYWSSKRRIDRRMSHRTPNSMTAIKAYRISANCQNCLADIGDYRPAAT